MITMNETSRRKILTSQNNLMSISLIHKHISCCKIQTEEISSMGSSTRGASEQYIKFVHQLKPKSSYVILMLVIICNLFIFIEATADTDPDIRRDDSSRSIDLLVEANNSSGYNNNNNNDNQSTEDSLPKIRMYDEKNINSVPNKYNRDSEIEIIKPVEQAEIDSSHQLAQDNLLIGRKNRNHKREDHDGNNNNETQRYPSVNMGTHMNILDGLNDYTRNEEEDERSDLNYIPIKKRRQRSTRKGKQTSKSVSPRSSSNSQQQQDHSKAESTTSTASNNDINNQSSEHEYTPSSSNSLTVSAEHHPSITPDLVPQTIEPQDESAPQIESHPSNQNSDNDSNYSDTITYQPVSSEGRKKKTNPVSGSQSSQLILPDSSVYSGLNLDHSDDLNNRLSAHLTEAQLKLLAELTSNKRSLDDQLSILQYQRPQYGDVDYKQDFVNITNIKKVIPPVKRRQVNLSNSKLGISSAPYAITSDPRQNQQQQQQQLSGGRQPVQQEQIVMTWPGPSADQSSGSNEASNDMRSSFMRDQINFGQQGSRGHNLINDNNNNNNNEMSALQLEDSFYNIEPTRSHSSKLKLDQPQILHLTSSEHREPQTIRASIRQSNQNQSNGNASKLKVAASGQHSMIASTSTGSNSPYPIVFPVLNGAKTINPNTIIASSLGHYPSANSLYQQGMSGQQVVNNEQYSIVPVNILPQPTANHNKQLFGYLRAFPTNQQSQMKLNQNVNRLSANSKGFYTLGKPYAEDGLNGGSYQLLNIVSNPQQQHSTNKQQTFRQMYPLNSRPILSGLQHRVGSSSSNLNSNQDSEESSASYGSISAASSSSSSTSDPMWSDSRHHQEDDYQQSPQTIQITAVPNGLATPLAGLNGLNGLGWNGWNGFNGPWNGRQVLLVNRQPQVSGEWRQWLLPVAIVLALPLILGALFVPVLLKSVMFLIQILQMLGLLMPAGQLAGHLASSAHNISAGR